MKLLRNRGMRQALWTIIEQSGASITLFVTSVLLARSVVKEEFGLYVLGLTIVVTAIGFQQALITAPYAILYHSKKPYERTQYLAASLSFQNIFLVCGGAVFLFAAIYMIAVREWRLLSFSSCLLIYFAGQASMTFFKYILIAQLDVRKNFFFCSTIYLFSLVTIASIYKFDILSTNITLIALGILSGLISFLLYRVSFRAESDGHLVTYSPKLYRAENWALGKWMAGSNVCFFFSSQIFPWLLLAFRDATSVAEFGVVMSATRILAPATQGLSSFLLPKLSNLIARRERMKGILIQLLGGMLVAGLLLVLLGHLFGDAIIAYLYSSQYSDLGILVTLGFLLQGLNLLNMPVQIALNAYKRTDLGFNSIVVSMVFALLFGVILTYKNGVVGSLISLLVSNLAGMLYRSVKLYVILFRTQRQVNVQGSLSEQ